jgi:hypothetical protein
MKRTYRVVRLYRQATGWSWWLQRGFWRTQGILSVKKKFVVEMEVPYTTKEAAERDCEYWSIKQ